MCSTPRGSQTTTAAAADPPPTQLAPLPAQPEGHGLYTWADGSTYEGSWSAGLKHGWGKYRWPSGAYYQGEWREGLIQVSVCGWEGACMGVGGVRRRGAWCIDCVRACEAGEGGRRGSRSPTRAAAPTRW